MKIYKIAQNNILDKYMWDEYKHDQAAIRTMIRSTDNIGLLREIFERALVNRHIWNSMLFRCALENSHCPPDILAKVLEKGYDDEASFFAANNDNCPPEALAKVLARGQDDTVSNYAALNPNCPPKAKIKWMQNIGKIGKEDPAKHIIEYEGKEQDQNQDLIKLRKMVSKKNNWYKSAVWYKSAADLSSRKLTGLILRGSYLTDEEFRNCTDAQKLKYIDVGFRQRPPRLLEDTQFAYCNDNIKRYYVNQIVALKTLYEDKEGNLERDVKISPEQFKNCSDELKKLYIDTLFSQGTASLDPEYFESVSPEIQGYYYKKVIGDMQECGMIEKEDPAKHVIEKQETKEDEDLKKLRDMISKKNFNLNKYAQSYSKELEDSYMAATTPKTEILRKILEREKNDMVSRFAAHNLNCPPDILAKILEREYYNEISYAAASNPRCPPEALAKLLAKGYNNRISDCAAKNPNCPLEAKIKWLQLTGKISKEDPTKHIIDYEGKQEDEDLQKLREMISKNNSNLNKYAQEVDWYNKYTAETTKDPKILRKILEMGYNNFSWTTHYAVENPNCPSDILVDILARGKDDGLSHAAISNPNCPQNTLIQILARGKDDGVSRFAAISPKCPLNILIQILARNKNDGISQAAAANPKCPLNVKIKWMQNTGQIEKEDPTKHIIDYEGKQDQDLIKLRKMIANKKFNLNKYAQEKWYSLETAMDTKDPEILRTILEQREYAYDQITYYAAKNIHCPPDVLTKIIEKNQTNVLGYNAADNPNCPPETLAKILEEGVYEQLSYYAAGNSNCPSEALVKVLAKGKDNDISSAAARNPNCPLEAKIKWMQLTGQIEKENPNKHVIEYEGKQDQDQDLNKLREMISKNNSNLNKYAKGKNWYNSYMAANTRNPPILKEILERGNNDEVSCAAARNIYCPPEALAKVLAKRKSNWVSHYAVQNPNCPPEAKIKYMQDTGKIKKEDPTKHIIEHEEEDLNKLREMISKNNSNLNKYAQVLESWYNVYTAKGTTNPNVLKEILAKGLNDNVSYYASKNLHCHPETLVEVLERKEYNSVSYNAAHNPNCPPKAKIKWMQIMGYIEKEDPSKHIIEKVKEDQDLIKLREMIL